MTYGEFESFPKQSPDRPRPLLIDSKAMEANHAGCVEYESIDLSYPNVGESIIHIANLDQLNDEITPAWAEKVKLQPNHLVINPDNRAVFNGSIDLNGRLEIEVFNFLLANYMIPSSLESLVRVNGLITYTSLYQSEYAAARNDNSDVAYRTSRARLLLRERKTQGIVYYNEPRGVLFLKPTIITDNRRKKKTETSVPESPHIIL